MTVGLLRQWHQITMDRQMMVLGTCMDEQLWVAMVPNKYFEEGYGENREEEVPVLETKMTALSTEHRYMMIMFITQVLDSMQHEDIHCMVEYPEPLTLESIKALMEILGRFNEQHWNIKLRLNDMKAFHGHFMNNWVEWVRKVPASWKQDGFLMENMPVGVCLQYGQNQPIMVSQAVEEERTNWSRDHDFRHIQQISFSLAMHISYLEVQRWHKVSLERITQNHGEVYDKPEHDASRVAVDLRELDLLDNDGYEINMYNKAGWRVLRQVPKESESCGALLDLDKVHELFQGRDEVHGEMTNEVEFWVYPLAFMQKYGNVKAHGIIPNMAACIGKLNESIFRGGMEDDDMEVDEGGEERVGLARRNLVIHGIALQIYNSLLHWVQNKAKFHLVQLGMMISALAGVGIETAWSHLQVLGPIKDSLKLFKADVMVRQHEWPVEAKTWWPMMSLKWAQQLTYGEAHYEHTRWMMWGDVITEIAQSARKATWAGQSHLTWDEYGCSLGTFFLAYEAKFMIKLAIENLLPNAYSHISNALFRQACYAAGMAFRVYFDDVKKLKPTSFIADIVIKQCSKDMAHNIPLFIKGGNFIHKAGTHAGHSGGELTGFVADAICAACKHLKINHIPWSRNLTSGAGQPSNVVVHEVQLNLGGQPPPAMGSQSMNVPAQWLNSVMAYQASQAIQAGDAHGEWTVAKHLLTEESNASIVKGAIWRIFGEAGLGGMRAEGEQAAQMIHHNGVRIYHLPYMWGKQHMEMMCLLTGWDFATAKGINMFLLAHLGLALIEMASGFWSAKWTVDIKPCEVVQLMKSGGMYGGFDVVWYLVGMKAAKILQMNQFMMAWALLVTTEASTSSKRRRVEWDEGDDDEGIIPCGSHGTQWKQWDIHEHVTVDLSQVHPSTRVRTTNSTILNFGISRISGFADKPSEAWDGVVGMPQGQKTGADIQWAIDWDVPQSLNLHGSVQFLAAWGSSGHHLLISAFMLASKVICDDTYSNKS
ncbi:hypothetical protein EDC04DRAFT_3023552 [Pisolithus marmoratus]|nr:hypothetical protein EDC04DRAFT_3023552 [Pisolithus marmoratus]